MDVVSQRIVGGNVYVIGRYYGTITIGSININQDDTGVSLLMTAFVAKYDTSGTVQWARSIGGRSPTSEMVSRRIVDGNVYVTGGYSGTVTIGSTTLTSVGSYDAFVAKYDTSGTVQWARTISGTSSRSGNGIATDSGGNVYVTGYYSGTVTIGSITLTSAGSMMHLSPSMIRVVQFSGLRV
jgi:hypothetical protein